MVIGDLGFCRGNFRKQRAFSHVRKTDEAHVRNHFEFQDHVVLFHLFALLREIGCMPTRRGETNVTFPAVAAARHEHFLPVFKHVANEPTRFFVANERSKRDFDIRVLSAFSKATVRAAHFAVFRQKAGRKTEREQIVHILIPDEIYVAALTAVAAVRTARGLAFKGFERIHTVATVARFY